MRRVEAVRRQTTKAGINGSEGWMYGAVLGVGGFLPKYDQQLHLTPTWI